MRRKKTATRRKSEVALALLPSDLQFLPDDFDEFGAVETLLLVGVEDSAGILEALDAFADLLEDEEFEVDRDSLGGNEVVRMRRDVYEFQAYEPGYIVTDEWAVAGSNIDGLEAFHDAASGTVGTLDSNPVYGRIIGLAPAPLHFLIYADISGHAGDGRRGARRRDEVGLQTRSGAVCRASWHSSDGRIDNRRRDAPFSDSHCQGPVTMHIQGSTA